MSLYDAIREEAIDGPDSGLSDTAILALAVAGAGDAIAKSLYCLGNGDASTHFGAMEAMSMKLAEAIELAAAVIAVNSK